MMQACQTALGHGSHRKCKTPCGSESHEKTVCGDAPPLGGSGPAVARAGGPCGVPPLPDRDDARANPNQGVSHRAPATGRRRTTRLLPGKAREAPLRALPRLPDSISLVILRSTGIALLIGFALGSGCGLGARPKVGTDPGQPEPPSAVVAGDVMSSRDRTRLEALAAERALEPSDGGYRVGPDDLLEIRIPDLVDVQGPWPRPGLGAPGPAAVAAAPAVQGVRVNASGYVSLPLIGLVRAEGFTPTELEAEIARRLVEAGILRVPQVSVQIAEYRSRVVAVVGSVERPGLYPLTRPRATLSDLVWAAGGPTKEAGRVVEFVPVGGSTSSGPGQTAPAGAPMRIDLEVLLHASGGHAGRLDPRVRPGDVITVSPAGSVLVDGWVDKPGSYPVTRGLTLSGAIAAAGGNLFPADRHHATVKRVLGPGEEHSFTVDLEAIAEGRSPDVPITDGDVVRVPSAGARLVPWGVWTVARDLVRVGGNVLLF